MTELATDPTSPESAPETAAQVWERTMNPNPITKEQVKGDDPSPEAPSLPDRALVDKQLRDFIASGNAETAPDPIAERLGALEESLVPKAQPENPAVYKEVVALREELAKRDQDAAEAVAAEEREAGLRTLRTGFIEGLREDGNFPAIVAAGLEEKVFNTVYNKLEANEEGVSYDQVASEAEADLWRLFDALSEVKNPTTSEEEEPSEAPKPQTPTITPTLTAADAPRDIESLLGGHNNDRRAAAAELWDSIQNR